jgi:hypothetical protein
MNKMTTFAVIVTLQDFSEGMSYLSDDFHEAAGMGRVVLDAHPGQFIRAWIKRMSLSRRQAAAFWAKQGEIDGQRDVACPFVPKLFAAIYRRNFVAGRKEAAQG